MREISHFSIFSFLFVKCLFHFWQYFWFHSSSRFLPPSSCLWYFTVTFLSLSIVWDFFQALGFFSAFARVGYLRICNRLMPDLLQLPKVIWMINDDIVLLIVMVYGSMCCWAGISDPHCPLLFTLSWSHFFMPLTDTSYLLANLLFTQILYTLSLGILLRYISQTFKDLLYNHFCTVLKTGLITYSIIQDPVKYPDRMSPSFKSFLKGLLNKVVSLWIFLRPFFLFYFTLFYNDS